MSSVTASVPSLFCPIGTEVSPYAEELDEHAERWLRQHRLYGSSGQLSRYIKSKFGSFAARVCPAADLESLRLYTEWLAFGFFYDDQFFDEAGGGGSIGSAAEAALAAISAFMPQDVSFAVPRVREKDRLHRLDVLDELVRRTAEVGRPEQFHRFCTQMTIWFYSYLYEPAVRAEGKPMSLSGYGANRLHNIATAAYVTLAELVTGCSVTAEQLALPPVRELSCLAAYQMAWCNDVHSAGREAAVNGLTENLISVLRREGCSPQQAMEESVRIHDRTMRSYVDLEASVLPGASAGVQEYLAVLRTWMRGHYDWCRVTFRYSTQSVSEPVAESESPQPWLRPAQHNGSTVSGK